MELLDVFIYGTAEHVFHIDIDAVLNFELLVKFWVGRAVDQREPILLLVAVLINGTLVKAFGLNGQVKPFELRISLFHAHDIDGWPRT